MHESFIVQRPWVYNTEVDSTRNRDIPVNQVADAASFTVLTYNILADMFVRDGLYTYCPADLRYMDSRHHRIIKEIELVNPDIICLQEVSKVHFEDELKNDLHELGFEGIYMSYPSHGHLDDGLAIFYKRRSLKLLNIKPCPAPFRVENYLQEMDCSDEDKLSIQHLVDRGQGVLIAKFTHLESGKTFTVGNVHIKWTYLSLPGLSCMEAACAVHALKEVAGPDGGFILTGDFNSSPDFGPYSLMNTGKFQPTANLWKNKPRQNLYPWNGDENAQPNVTVATPLANVLQEPELQEISADKKLANLMPHIIQTNKPLKSAYKQVTGKEPDVTNCDAYAWEGYVHELCVDYMWYTDQHLVPEKVLEAPSRELIRKYHGLPSKLFPSDHIPMATTFKLL